MLFARNAEEDNWDSFSNYYLRSVEIKNFNVFIDGISFFDLPVKNEEEAYKKIIEMSTNNDYTTGNLLHFAYFKKNYKLIATDLSKQAKLKDQQQINFLKKLVWQNNGATMLFINEKSKETTFEFFTKLYEHLTKMETQKTVNLLNSSENKF